MREPRDWRLTNQERYLRGLTLQWRRYAPARGDNDHDHCEFCWKTFTAEARPDTLQQGYATLDGYRWICKPCFDDFVDSFEWKVADSGVDSR